MNKKFYLYDCGEVAQTIAKTYGNLISVEGFISNENQDTIINGLRVYNLNEVINQENFYIVVTTNRELDKIYDELKSNGLIQDKQFCHYKEWIRKYFETKLNENHKLIQDYVELYLTDRCTLRCKNCILFAPYAKPQVDRSLDDVKRDIDLYFKYVDKVSVFRLMGGEPFLYPQIEEVIDYIINGGGYSVFINSLIIVSNGTIIPSKKVLSLIAKNNIEVHISDYPIQSAQAQRSKLIEAFEKFSVKYKIKLMRWVDVHSEPLKAKHKSKEELIKLFKECYVRCRTIIDGKLYFCAIDSAAQRRNYIKGSIDDYVDLTVDDDLMNVKKKILALDSGNIGKGYVSFCRNCYGGTDSNNRIIEVAEQI